MYRLLHLLLIYTFLMVLPKSSFGQMRSDSLLKKYIREIEVNLEKEEYQSAMDNLKKVFSLKITLPDEIAYYYGYTLVKQGNYVKGKEALHKYIELKGSGKYVEEAKRLLIVSESNICQHCLNTGHYDEKENCGDCQGSGKLIYSCRSCSGKGQVLCNVCRGTGVVRRGSDFGEKYQNCTRCSAKGVVDCSSCNGSSVNKSLCKRCKGEGKLVKKVRCNH